MDALTDHEVVKFIGRDCRALEAGYNILLAHLCEDSDSYVARLELQHASLIVRQQAAANALENVEMQERDSDFAFEEEAERLSAHRDKVEAELDSTTAELLAAVAGIQPPPMQEKVCDILMLLLEDAANTA